VGLPNTKQLFESWIPIAPGEKTRWFLFKFPFGMIQSGSLSGMFLSHVHFPLGRHQKKPGQVMIFLDQTILNHK
jgi:hypothetical protein